MISSFFHRASREIKLRTFFSRAAREKLRTYIFRRVSQNETWNLYFFVRFADSHIAKILKSCIQNYQNFLPPEAEI